MGLLDALRDAQFRSDIGTNARQLGQSASNTIAEGVTMPVDALAWLLRRSRVPVPQNPIGGSDWAKQMGLMADVPQGAPKVAGEALGLLAPMLGTKQGAAAAAKGLNKMADNVAAPRTMNPQTGAIVWHGSPHKFDKFDASKIGTGEGSQAYGHGLYLAEAPDVAKNYAENLALRAPQQNRTQILAEIKRVKDTVQGPRRGQLLKQLNDDLAFIKSGAGAEGQIYKVDLPDEQIARMLDWDKPLSQQAPEVRAAVQKVVPPFNDDMVNVINRKIEDASLLARTATDTATKKAAAQEHARLLNSLRTRQPEVEGKGLMSYLGSPVQASSALRDAGIPGIRYLDGGSRGTGQGTSNFVVFPGNENMLQILERNGQPLGLLK